MTRKIASHLRATCLLLVALVSLIAVNSDAAPDAPIELPASLDLEEALKLFRSRGLELLLADSMVAQSRAAVTAAGALPNPLLSGSISKAFDYNPNDPATCPPGSGCSDVGGQIVLTDQALWDVVSGKRGLRLQIARAGIALAQLERRDVERQLVFQLKQQLTQAALAQRLVEFSQEVVTAAEQTAELGRQRLAAGAISEVDLARAETEHLVALQGLDMARRELRLRQLEVAFLLGARGPVPEFQVRLELRQHDAFSGELPTDATARAQAIALALAQRPDLQAQDAARTRAEANLSAAYRQRVPDVSLSVGYQQQGRGQTAIQPPTLTVGAGVTLPLLNHGQGAIEKGRAELSAQSLQRQKRQAQVVAEVESSYAALETNRRLIERLERELLGRASKARDLVRLRYEKGAASLLEYLDAQRVYIATHREYFVALGGYFSARFGLESALGLGF